MNFFIEFLKKYWFQLACGCYALLMIILVTIKRKPKSISDFKLCLQEALARVPEYVIHVEEPGNGQEKLAKVVKLGLAYISNKLGRSLSDDEAAICLEQIVKKVETVLCTPTKKEVVDV